MPAQDDLPPLREMIERAAKRPDLAAQKASITTAEISNLGTRNGVLPSLQVFGAESHAGLAGTPKVVPGFAGGGDAANQYFVGGLGTGLGQIFRRDFSTDRIGTFLQTPIGNRQALADQGIDLLQLRQTQLTTQKALNQAGVDVLNAVIALRQARVRYDAAVQNRKLTEELLHAEERKFTLGASTPYEVVQQQRDLTAAQSSEISALASYNNARVALDQTMGTTLEANHVALGEVRNGRVERSSALPAAAPSQP
jgi:outer membrane protein